MTLEPEIALRTAERALRQLMESRYRDVFGAEWLIRIASDEKRKAWSSRRDSERGKRGRRGVSEVSDRLLDYANLYDLLEICEVEAHWAPLARALGHQRSFTSLLGRLEIMRDCVAHGRQLLPFERDLASGIAGDIRNRVTIFMSTQDDHGEYFARMESAPDSFGNEVSGGMQEDGSLGGSRTGLTLREGDLVLFQCTGWDAQGRELKWKLLVNQRLADIGEGNEVTLNWTVSTKDVGITCTVNICMWPEGSEYRRYPQGGSDGRAFFYYKVLPSRPSS